MRFLKSKLLAVVVLAGFIILLAVAWIMARRYTNSLDTYWTPSTMISGVYSIDDGPWIKTDLYEPIDDHFHRIIFKGRIVTRTRFVNELDISLKNIWFTLETDDGEMIYSNMYRIEDSKIWNAKMNEEAVAYLTQIMPIAMRLPYTPGYEHVTFLIEEDFPNIYDKELIMTVENPYPFTRSFSDCALFIISTGNGAFLRTARETLSMILFFLLTGFFGIFLFPMASVIFGRINYRYLSFGFLCFFGGVFMLVHFQSWILNIFISDPVLCMMIERTASYAFFAALVVYCRSNMRQDISRTVAGIAVLAYVLFVAAALILQLTGGPDLVAAGSWFNALVAVIIPVYVVLLARESKLDRRAFRYLLSWIPLVVTYFFDVIDQFRLFKGKDFFIYGFAVTLAVQFVQLVFDLQRQYKEALHYQQIQRELYEARVTVMTSQIRPHFMYNALTSIAMMCTLDPPTAQEATVTFAKYLRENMDSLKQNRPVPFEQELDHLKKYLYIEKLRFQDKLQIEYDITVTDFVLPILTVQPLVENAVKHGVGMKKKGGTVKIATRETPEAYEVIVTDDGVGFDTSAPRPDDGRTHVGMLNTRTRLKQMCGGEIRIESTVGEGTVATVILPKEGQENENNVSG